MKNNLNRRQLCKLLAMGPAAASLRAQTPPPYVYPRWNINAMHQHLISPSPDRVLIAAHRGLWRDTPENSETGFRLSFAKWEMIETDLLKSSDYSTQNELLITHDPEISRTLNGTGWHYNINMAQFRQLRLLDRFGALYSGGNWYPADKDGTPRNDASTGVGRNVLSLSDLLRIHKDFIAGTDATPFGPIIIFDVKAARNENDPDWNTPGRGIFSTMNIALSKLSQLPLGQRKAIIFMFRYNLLPVNSQFPAYNSRQNLEHYVPAYANYDPVNNPLPRLMPIFNYEDALLPDNPGNDTNFMSIVQAPSLSHFEMNQWYLGDGCQKYLEFLRTLGKGISTYSENSFFPEGVWDINKFAARNQDFTQPDLDFRQLPDYTMANSGVGLITTERPDETDAFLRTYNLRNLPIG